MPDSDARRVHKVRLRAASEALVRRGAIILEDALRTASIPHADSGRLLIVRSLSVGTIRSDQSPASVALNVERRLRQLGVVAVHAGHPAASRQPAVYFRDDAEPYVRLALRLARGESADDWFWPLAVPAWRPGQSRDEALRRVFYGALQTQAGVAAAVHLIQELHEQEAVEELLAALRWQDGPALLQAFGWPRPGVSIALATPPPPGREAEVEPRWGAILVGWIGRWGAGDARSTWLAGVALLAEKPGRLLDPRLPMRARQLLKLAAEAPDRLIHPGPAPRAETQPEPAPPQEIPFRRRKKTGQKRASPLHLGQKLISEGETTVGIAVEPTPQPTPVPETASARPTPGRNLESVDIPDPGVSVSEEMIAATTLKRAVQPVGKEEEPVARRSAVPITAEERRLPGEASPPLSRFTFRTLHPKRPAARESPTPPWPETPQLTSYGGLFFLVPVLSRLGMAAFLEAHPHWIERGLPIRLLQYAGQRLRVPVDDPVMAILGSETEEESDGPYDFVAPAAWRQGICAAGPWVLRRVEDEVGRRILLDGSGRLPVGLWQGKAPAGARSLVGDQRLRRGPPAAPESPLQLALRAWLTAARRWCRRYAQIGLRDLVCRPGRIAATRTHVDVLFDRRQADVRIRKAGLDLDPGWVAWLGRVVYFHYLTEEEADVFANEE
jgi:hypothetical protein